MCEPLPLNCKFKVMKLQIHELTYLGEEGV